MELKTWCRKIRNNLNELSDFSKKNIPFTVETLLQECEKAVSDIPDNDDQVVKIALVGAFSSGKSSFLNAIFDQDLTAVDINRTTRCRTDFTSGDKFRIINIRNGKELDQEEYKTASRTGQAKEESHYLITLPDPRLNSIIFMDTPGFDPPPDADLEKEQQDSEISKRAAQDADVCFFLMVTKDGTLQGHCLEYLKQLNDRTLENSDNPLKLVIILNQADLKMPSAREKIMKNVAEICQKNQINVDKFLLHTARKPKKNPEFYSKCQEDIWQLVHDFQQKKSVISAARKGVWAKLSRQSLFDLRDILDKFIDFQIEQLEKQNDKNSEQTKDIAKANIGEIADQIKELVMDFARNHRWSYSSNYSIDDSGIFGWEWTKDWKAYITNDNDKVIPCGDARTELMQKIKVLLCEYSIPSPEVYAERFMKDIDNFILSVFREDDGNGYYRRCGKSCKCSTESDADKQSEEWQREYLYELDERADKFFQEHVESGLESLLKSQNQDEKMTLKKDHDICYKIRNLLFHDFPSLQSKNTFQHPVLDDSMEIQKKYVALLCMAKSWLDEKNGNRIGELARKINVMGNLNFSEEQLNSMTQKDAVNILTADSDDDSLGRLLVYCLTDIGFFSETPEDESKATGKLQKISCFKNMNFKEFKGIFDFGSAAQKAKDLWELAERAKDCPNRPVRWAYLMINRRFDEEECNIFQAVISKFSWQEIFQAHEENNFTFRKDGSLFLETCMWPFDRNAADFLLQHGCDISAEQDGENVAQKINMFLSDEAFEYLLDNHIQLSDDFWNGLFMMDKAALIEIAMHHNTEIPSEAVFQPFMDLSTIQAYGDNGGNLALYSENTQSSLIDFFIMHDKNDIVEYLKSKGINPSDDAMSLHQLLDELESLK